MNLGFKSLVYSLGASS